MLQSNPNRFLCGLYSEEQKYKINGVRYIVESRFESYKDNHITTIADRFGKVITSDFTQLPTDNATDTIDTEYVSDCIASSDAGKED